MSGPCDGLVRRRAPLATDAAVVANDTSVPAPYADWDRLRLTVGGFGTRARAGAAVRRHSARSAQIWIEDQQAVRATTDRAAARISLES